MILYDEIYFEINLKGSKNDIKRFADFLTSGELDDFFEISSDYINFDESPSEEDNGAALVFTNDDIGVEINKLDVEDFLDVFCKAARSLDVSGTIYDIDDSEFAFTSPAGDSYYYDSSAPVEFNDELDDQARKEDIDDEDEE